MLFTLSGSYFVIISSKHCSSSITCFSKAILLKNMIWLIEKGITFSLDDFGDGRSNLNYLSAMPVSVVKFDQSVTDRFFKEEKSHRITTDVVRMLHNLNLKIVAEGVETKEQALFLRSIGCESVQGYYFAKPMNRERLLRFYEEKNSAT